MTDINNPVNQHILLHEGLICHVNVPVRARERGVSAKLRALWVELRPLRTAQ